MNKLVILRIDKYIISVLGQFRTKQQAEWFIEDNYPEFRKEDCQYSEFQSPRFITID